MIVFIVLHGHINALQFARILASLFIFLRVWLVSSVSCWFIFWDTQRNGTEVSGFLSVNLNSVFKDTLSVSVYLLYILTNCGNMLNLFNDGARSKELMFFLLF